MMGLRNVSESLLGRCTVALQLHRLGSQCDDQFWRFHLQEISQKNPIYLLKMMDTGKIASIQGKITDVNSIVEATERASSKTDR